MLRNRSQRRARTKRRGGAAIAALLAVVTLMGMSGAILTIAHSSHGERNVALNNHKALYSANSGLAAAVARMTAGDEEDMGSYENPVAFSDGSFWAAIDDNEDGTFTVTSTGAVRGRFQAIEAVVAAESGGIFDNAVFAGNSSEDPLYSMGFGGSGIEADDINGDLYSGGDLSISGDATVEGTLRAGGVVSGAPGESNVSQPIPDLAAMNYESLADFNVSSMFESATYQWDNAGGNAWQLPESSPGHIFRKNPSDRSSANSSTTKHDYFLEDPYETVTSGYNPNGSDAYKITVSGVSGEPGVDSNNKIFFIDGNLWVHNYQALSLKFAHAEQEGLKVTFVVKGDIYFADNLLYSNSKTDGVAFIAMNDSDLPDESGNIYFGDPEFGTLQHMQSFMYAENNFYDINLDASGSSTVQVDGIMSAGNHVKIDRDTGGHHTKLTVNWDSRVSSGDLEMPGLPGVDLTGNPSYTILSWRKVATP